MSGTRKVEISGSEYLEITSADNFLFQNTSSYAVSCVFADSLPDASFISPHVLQQGEGLVRNGLTGNLYAKGDSSVPSKINVTVSE